MTDQLKNEHQALLGLLDEARAAGLATEEGRQKMLSARRALLGHLEKEDSELYPQLKRLADTDQDVARIMSTFSEEMATVGEQLLGLFNAFEDGPLPAGRMVEAGKILGLLRARIQREETVLYAAHDNRVS